ncbi:MAG: 4Fe-4S dicluster domain-containing protein [Sedimentisphaerales bacterium]|nr:4Fe-4S dicluster domain-containing protein [Sedimentisphaerales bacterium]
MWKLSKKDFQKFVTAMIGSDQQVVGVQAKGDRFAFGPLEQSEDLRLDYDVTLLPPKKYVLPQVETLMTYKIGGDYQSEMASEKLILLGVHPYDLIAINQMDKLFSQDQYDNHYMARRKNITMIACDVVTPSQNVFASSMGTAVVTEGYDILITEIGDGYVLDAATDKGKALMKLAPDATEASQDDLAKRKAVQDKNRTQLNKHPLECKPSYLPKLLERAYDHPIWEEKARTCYSCGSCNTTCPTCYCFDVQDDVNWDLATGKRWRAWDGCLLENFATVAGNHNFRKQRESRFRHRLYRKAKYIPEKIGGEIACVGCGRCITACIPDIANPVAIYNALLEDIGME